MVKKKYEYTVCGYLCKYYSFKGGKPLINEYWVI